MSNEAVNRVLSARASLLNMAPFFGVLSKRLEIEVDPSCKSMWTDTVKLGVNPDYVRNLSILEIQAVLCKLVMKIAAGLAWRRGSRDMAIWNKAATLAVLPSVKEMNLIYPGKEQIRPEFVGFSTEAIYIALLNEKTAKRSTPQVPPRANTSSEGDEGAVNEDSRGEGDSDGQAKDVGDTDSAFAHGELRQAPQGQEASLVTGWAVAVRTAATYQGNLPGSLVLQLKDALIQPLPWRQELQHFARKLIGNGRYSFAKPNRNHLHRGLILPTKGKRKRLGTVVVVRDTSGSAFNGPYLGMFNAAIEGLIEDMQPEKLFVLDVDVRVTNVQTVMPGKHEVVKREAKGGGGTDFNPPFKWVSENSINDVACLIYLTDMCGKFPIAEPPYPVLWVKTDLRYTNHLKAPFGQEIILKEA